MQTWLALLGAPSMVLLALSLNYALVSSACEWRSDAPLQGVTAGAFAFAAFATVLAWHRWRARRGAMAPDDVRMRARAGFLAFVAMCVGFLSSIVLLAMWLPQWLLSPCQ